MFDPFNDFEAEGYLRNVRKDKNPQDIKRFEHDLFEANMAGAFDYLATRHELAYRDFLAVHKILFSDYYPWAGQDRLTTTPNSAVRKADVFFAHPQDARRAVEHGLRLAQEPSVLARKPGEVMGLFAYGHPFLDGNGRAMLLVHMELSYRAGFTIQWEHTSKSAYLEALSREIDTPGKGILDTYLLQFKGLKLERDSWGVNILGMKGLDGLDSDNQIEGDLFDPAVAEKYRQLVERRSYSYTTAESLADKWSAVPGKYQCAGKIVALSETEVIQDAGRGQHVAWDRRKLQDSNLDVGKKVTIHESGKVVHPQPSKGLEL